MPDADPPASGPRASSAPPASGVQPADAPRIPASAVRAHLARADVRAAITLRVKAKIKPRHVEDVVSHCMVELLAAHPPRSEVVLPAWTFRIVTRVIARATRRSILDAFREPTVDDFDGLADVTPLTEEPPDEVPLTKWLEEAVDSDTDRETLALLREKGGGDDDDAPSKTYAEVAAAHDMTEAALKKRVARFLTKYQERRQRYLRDIDRRDRMIAWLVVLLLGAVLAAVAFWGMSRHAGPPAISPEPAVSSVPSVPTAPSDDRKNVANPPLPTGPDDAGNPRLKP
jgi:DNA-directed RNA polymerase specialized sigma24 family protein